MTDDVDEPALWTAEARERTLAAGRDLLDQLSGYLGRLVEGVLDDDVVGEMGLRLNDAASAFSDAHLDLTGQLAIDVVDPPVYGFDDDGDETAEASSDPRRVIVLQRADYEVTDAAAIRDRARELWRSDYPDASIAEVDAHVASIGSALYVIAHHGAGWDHLHDVDGLEPIVGVQTVYAPDEDDEGVPADLVGAELDAGFTVLRGEVLFRSVDTWRW